MQKLKLLSFLVLVSGIIASITFLYDARTRASNGEPRCCLGLSGEYPNQLMSAFAGKTPSQFKILGVMTTHLQEQIPVEVLAIIDKALITDLKSAKIILSLRVPQHVLEQELTKGDYLLLIPLAEYSPFIPKDMYDFVKIPKEMIR